ncbi:hypothetical protein [Peribacillus acanthi]|uniref:hypothetical protein n=1 Tax=Peribacillus acanthi TaxID=2171554 RepID=UPI000D3E654F|nr:hypothetical protein [Peribacillus acanthi]
MKYDIKLLKSIRTPKDTFLSLHKAEQIRNLPSQIIILLIFPLGIAMISSWFGIGTESISGDIVNIPIEQFEEKKWWFAFGHWISSILYSAIILYLGSIWFWTLSEIPFQKLLVTQCFVLSIILIEKTVNLLLHIYLSIPWYSSPFSLGVISQIKTNKSFWISFFGSITVFKIWTIYLQYNALKQMSELSRWKILLVILFINVLGSLFISLGNLIQRAL